MATDMSIGTLKSKISSAGGLQRNNRFYVKINAQNFPPFDETAGPDGTPQQYIAETVILPDISMTTQADGLAGPGLGRTVPRGLFYKEGVLITFPVFGNWKLVQGLDDWMKKMYYQNQGNPSVWVTNYYNNSQFNLGSCSLEVTALDLSGNKVATYTFLEAYPIEIAPIQFSTLSTNEYLKLTVRFIFREYTLETIAQQ